MRRTRRDEVGLITSSDRVDAQTLARMDPALLFRVQHRREDTQAMLAFPRTRDVLMTSTISRSPPSAGWTEASRRASWKARKTEGPALRACGGADSGTPCAVWDQEVARCGYNTFICPMLQRLTRYEAHLERSLDRATEVLRREQARRRLREALARFTLHP